MNLDSVLETVLSCFPTLNFFEQHLSLELYRLLAQGEPVTRDILAQRLAMPVETVNQVLGRWPGVFSDSQQRLVGYWGLTIPTAYKSQHRFIINGRTLSAWCAWDTLFLPQLLGGDAAVESRSPSGDMVSLLVSPSRVERVAPAGTHMSFLLPDQAGVQRDVVTTFCHFIHFFSSRQSGETWATNHPGVFLLSMEDAFSLALRKNEAQYGETLGSQVA